MIYSHLNHFFLFLFWQDIDECQLNTDECDINASCNNTDGSYQCICNSGYWGSGLNCTDKRSSFIHAETMLVTYYCFYFNLALRGAVAHGKQPSQKI